MAILNSMAVEKRKSAAVKAKGKRGAQTTPPPRRRRKVRFGSMRGRIHLLPGWDDPVDLDRFLEGEI
jgi:hypothetical protein